MNARMVMTRGLVGAALSLALAGCSSNSGPAASPTAAAASPTVAAAATTAAPPTVAATATPTATATPLSGVCPPNPDPAPPSVAVVNSPLPNASVTSPLTVTGMVAAFEAQFAADLLDAGQQQLVAVHGMAQQGQMLSPFTVTLSFSVNAPTPGCLRIYQQSPKDGSLVKFVQVPVVLMP